MKLPKLTNVEWVVIIAIIGLVVALIVVSRGFTNSMSKVEVVKTGVVKNVDYSTPDKVIVVWEDGTKTVLDEDFVSSSLSYREGERYTLQRKGFSYDLVEPGRRPKTR